MQNFDYSVKSVEALTSQDRKLDKIFTSEMTLDDCPLSGREQLMKSKWTTRIQFIFY